MRFCSHELGKKVQLRDGEVGQLSDFIITSNDFKVREVKIHTGMWPFAKDYNLPPDLVNFLKSDSDHIFIDLTEDELKNHYKEPPTAPTESRADFFAFEEPWGVPYSWSREDGIMSPAGTEGAITGHDPSEIYHSHNSDLTLLYSATFLCRSELYLNGEAIAQVTDVVIEPVQMQARFIVCQGFSSGDKLLLLPLEWIASIDQDSFQLSVSDLTPADFDTAPNFNYEDVINSEAEDQLCAHYGKNLSWRETGHRYRGNRPESPTILPSL